jgi:hypothetical protein
MGPGVASPLRYKARAYGGIEERFPTHGSSGAPPPIRNVKNYDGSWTEWGNLVRTPIEKP